jgi:HlyD family secretion protein
MVDKMRACLKWLLLMVFAHLLVGCGGAPTEKQGMKTYVVSMLTIHKTLHFTGTVQPLQESPLTSPMEAVVETMQYHYGQQVKKDAEVFTLNSTELQKQYNDTLTEYLKAKDSYSVSKARFTGTEDLWNAGLLSKNNYVSEKSSLNTTRVSLMQATRKLSEMLEKMGDGTYQDLSTLSFSDFDKVRSALSGKHDLIHLKSPSNGVLLYAPKANDDKSGRITVGTAIKAGQTLALIGDLSGIRVEIDVPEIDIDKIKPEMPATVHGVAFAKQELKGKLVAINAQASPSNGSPLPSFTAIVEVNGLDAKQQSWIKVGMSATIELSVDSIDKLVIPIAAVSQKNGQSFVHVRAKNGSISVRPIVTGAAQADKVVIDSGLSAGEVVTYSES